MRGRLGTTWLSSRIGPLKVGCCAVLVVDVEDATSGAGSRRLCLLGGRWSARDALMIRASEPGDLSGFHAEGPMTPIQSVVDKKYA